MRHLLFKAEATIASRPEIRRETSSNPPDGGHRAWMAGKNTVVLSNMLERHA
jgi:hypothetical protein